MIDTHCHMACSPLAHQLPVVLARAAAAGVRQMITVGTKFEDAAPTIKLARAHKQISCAVGIHPHHAAETTPEQLDAVMAMFDEPDVLAAGEMGLDYHYEFSPRESQRRVFDLQLAEAVRVGKPLVLHCREAMDDCLAILKSHGFPAGVFHCYTGTAEEARRVLDAGYYIGFAGIVTFKNSEFLREIAAFVPGDRILLETDAPYLSPEPMRRQKINEPALVAFTFKRVAEVRRVAVEDFIQQTDLNAQSLLGMELIK